MMNIIKYPDKFLKSKCIDVLSVDRKIINILDDMTNAMYQNNGVGLAAPQVGIDKNIVVIDIREPAQLYKMINPKIVYKSDNLIDSSEGCLSVPYMTATIKRYEKIIVEYLDQNAQQCRLDASDLLSICIQHELDHLDGKLYIDHLSSIQRFRFIKKYNKIINEIYELENIANELQCEK